MKALSCAITLSFPAYSQTLEQAVAHSITHNPSIKASYNEFKSKVYSSQASSGAYLPKIDLDAGIGYESVDLASGIDNSLTRKEATLSLTQLIWDGSSTLNDMDRTAAEAESVRLQLLSDAQDIALEVSKIYLDVVKASEVLALSEANLSVHKNIHRDIKKRVESGIGSTADLTQVEARLAKANGNLLAAQNNLYDSQTQFMRLVGQAPQDLVFPRADKNAIPANIDDALKRAFDNHPVIKVAQSDVDSARFQYKQSKGTNLPTFSFEANQTWREDSGGIEGSSDEFSAMLRMRYNLYNGGSDADRSESMVYQLNKAKDLRDRTFRTLEEGLRLSWSALDLTLQQKEFLAEHVDAASSTVIAYNKQYKLGKRTLLDLLNTENELFEARKGYLDAKYAEQYAKYRVLNATGGLLDALRVDTPEAWNEAVEY
nr:TolC family outer membrane protein [Vibrio hepatarius]